MKNWYEKPDAQIKELVRTVLVVEGLTSSESNDLPVFTNGMPALFCKTEKTNENFEQILQLAVSVNLPSEFLNCSEKTTLIVYFFKPFVLNSIFNIAAKVFSQKPFELNLWDPHKFNALKTQLIYSKNTLEKISILNHLIHQQWLENEQVFNTIQFATDRIIQQSGKEIISEILETLNINERTFQRMFKKYVGITPTQYRRICQLQQSFDQLRKNRFGKISEVAYDNGFADQSHFIRTFKEFTQTTPKDYLKKGLKGN